MDNLVLMLTLNLMKCNKRLESRQSDNRCKANTCSMVNHIWTQFNSSTVFVDLNYYYY